MKELSKLKIIIKESLPYVLNERNLLEKLNHPFLVTMHFSFQDNNNLYYILDYKECFDLRYYYSKDITFNEEQSKFFISCLILSLEYLHTNIIVHRDVKPENLIFDSIGYVYLTDFGLARVINNNDIDFDGGGSLGYISPEVFLKKRYSFTADYFSVGIILYELMLLTRPYYGKKKELKKQFMDNQKQITKEQHDNRVFLHDIMVKHGFIPLANEWWHFSLEREPYPNTYFDFPIHHNIFIKK